MIEPDKWYSVDEKLPEYEELPLGWKNSTNFLCCCIPYFDVPVKAKSEIRDFNYQTKCWADNHKTATTVVAWRLLPLLPKVELKVTEVIPAISLTPAQPKN